MLLAFPSVPSAHEIPRGVTVHGFVRVESQQVRLLIRAPLESMRDIDFPTRGPGQLLVISQSESLLRQAADTWIADAVSLYADGELISNARVTAVRASIPSDGAFASFESAAAHMRGTPLSDSIGLPWMQAMLDVEIVAPIPNDSTPITIEPRWAQLGVNTTTVLHVIDGAGKERLVTFEGNPGRLGLDPGWLETTWRFVVSGFGHILDGIDHLLFLLCLVIPVRRLWSLVGIVTSFTIAHSITLGVSAFGFAPSALWFPPFIEVLIALSIVYMALENIVGAKIERRWMIAFGFGLVHGFGFSFALRESLQFAGSHLLVALAAFNIGVELGQLLVLAVTVPVLALVYRYVVKERVGVLILSALVAHQAWHWMTERFSEFRAYELSWPVMDRTFLIGVIRFVMLLMIAGGAMWAMSLIGARVRAMRAARTTALIAALLVPLAFIADSADAQQRTTMTGVYTARQADQGKEVFNGNCLGCHTAASHTGAAFTRWIGRPLSELFDYIATQMPKSSPGSLTEDEYVWVTAYMLKLNGMPAGAKPLNAEPKELEAIRIDSVGTAKKATESKLLH